MIDAVANATLIMSTVMHRNTFVIGLFFFRSKWRVFRMLGNANSSGLLGRERALDL